MLLCRQMITGFNTDVQHEGQVYHVQTEDRGQNNPVLESLVYIGGTIVAKKLTPYAEQLSQGADEQLIAGLLKRQHQVMIAAIKTGRVHELMQHYANHRVIERSEPVAGYGEAKESKAAKPKRNSGDYPKRNSQQGRLDWKVIAPSVFVAGKNVGLRGQVLFNAIVEPEAVVTIKIIGTAFKPQVYIGRAGRDGIANFSLSLPSFTAGTAAIVIEAQSNRGRGELKHLIRRA